MGSCKSSGLIQSKEFSKTQSCYKYIECKEYVVAPSEIEFFQILFKELCIRNNSKSLLEKSTFLSLIKLPVRII